MTEEPTKRCYNCKEHLPLDRFYNDKSKRDEKSSECKACCRARSKKRWFDLTGGKLARPKRTPEEIAARKKAYGKRYREENKERVQASIRAWHKSHREYLIEYRKATKEHRRKIKAAWYEKNKEHVRQYDKKRAEANPEKIIARRAVDKALKSGELVKLPCEACGCKDVEAHHEDYYKPLDVNWLCKSHHAMIHSRAGIIV